jgi:hypothetical protein
MPKAAWCSACSKYVWVSTDGGCQYGHGPECISDIYEDEAAGETQVTTPVLLTPTTETPGPLREKASTPLLWLAVAVAVFLGGTIAFAAYSAWTPSPPSSASVEPVEPDTSVAADSSATADQNAPPYKKLSAKGFDKWVAKEYPGYTIKQRFLVTSQWEAGLDGTNYLLVNKRQPKFQLLVGLAQPGPDQAFPDDAPDAYVDEVRGLWTTDALFSANAHEHTVSLSDRGQDAIIDGYVAKRPSSDAVVFGGYDDEEEFDFPIGTGEKAVERALKDIEDTDYLGMATIPHGPNNSLTEVEVETW